MHENSGNFRFMGTPIIRKIPQYRNLPRILRELSDCTGWNNFRLIGSLVLRHPIICTEFNGLPCNSVRYCLCNITYLFLALWPMRPKARGQAQHGGPPGWLEESDPAGCDFVCDGRALPYSTGVDLTGAAQLTDSSCCYIVNVHC